jgi:cell wall assembly regulator SMI1
MKQDIEALDELLRKHRSQYYAQLNTPLTATEISALEAKYEVRIPAEVIALYSWKDGQDYDCSDAFVNNSMFIPLEAVLATAHEFNGMIGTDFEAENWWNENWFPIFHNGGGDYICYDSEGTFTGERGQLIEFWHADADRNVIAPSLGAFLEKLVSYYQNTPPSEFDEYFEIGSTDGYPKSFVVE